MKTCTSQFFLINGSTRLLLWISTRQIKGKKGCHPFLFLLKYKSCTMIFDPILSIALINIVVAVAIVSIYSKKIRYQKF